jgi:hypothetical protein
MRVILLDPPVALCIGFELNQTKGIRWIFENITYLHFTLLFSSAINDAYLRRPFGKATYYHTGCPIKSLNENLVLCELQDSTIAVVSSLVIACAIFTDYKFTILQQPTFLVYSKWFDYVAVLKLFVIIWDYISS